MKIKDSTGKILVWGFITFLLVGVVSAVTITTNIGDATTTTFIDTNTFYLNPTTNKVGIGTSTPSETLTVSGTGSYTGALSAATLDTGQGANELYAMNQDVETTDTVRFGNVGIGTNAVTPLHVAGMTSDYAMFLDKNDRMGICFRNTAGDRKTCLRGYGGGANEGDFYLYDDVNNRNVFIYDQSTQDFSINGNTGIGTSSPVTTLEVFNTNTPALDNNMYSISYFSRSGTGGLNISGRRTASTATRDTLLQSENNGVNADLILNLNGGNVGVGLQDPVYKFQVEGTIQADDYYSGDGTQGMTGSCGAATTLTVKDGLITGCV